MNNIDVVLVQEELHPTGIAMLDLVFGFRVKGISNTTAGILQSAQVGAPVHELHRGVKDEEAESLRARFKANKTLCAAIRRANSYDVLLHSEAKRIFSFNKAAMWGLL